MARPSLNRNDVVLSEGKLAKMPLGDRGLSLCHAFEEDMDWHDEDKPAHCNMHLPATNFVVGDTFHKNRQDCCGHTRHLRLTIRQLRNGCENTVNLKRLITKVSGLATSHPLRAAA